MGQETANRLPSDWRPRTIYLGGGTPGELTTRGVADLVEILAPYAGEATEITVEANPRTLLRRKLLTLRDGLGVNRVSLGSQSFSPRLLKTLGRFHRPRDVEAAVEIVRSVGIESLSLDLIFAVPGQTLDDLQQDLRRTLALEPEHVSVYCLTIEPGTAFHAARERGRLIPASEGAQARYFAEVRRTLRAEGFLHYEISNFARPGRLCLHNRIYWRNGHYYGVGNSAASHVEGVRTQNHRDVAAYVDAVESGRGAIETSETLPYEQKVRETAYLALRTSEGIVPRRFQRDTGADPRAFFADALPRLMDLGLLEEKRGRIRLTGRGVTVADAVAVEIL